MPKAKLMSSVEITEEPDGEQFKGLLQELQVRNPHENRGALTGCAGTVECGHHRGADCRRCRQRDC